MTPVLAASLAHGLLEVGRGLRESLFMLWETLWALVFGFGLSGAVQAFVSREELQARLGDHRSAAVARASFYGMISSSCSYAASAMAKSLFQKGADFVSTLVFMFASTNLVVELGVVLVVLIGWQFAAAEFVGGAIMILLLAVLGALWLRGREVEEARQRLQGADAHSRRADDEAAAGVAWTARIRSLSGWADASGYTISDLTMLRREMVVGYVVAGLLSVLVPVGAWNAVFVHGHGWLTLLENALVGPFIAVISFVCSIGNVPLAAALWRGGISFGGVVSFVFADLITIPLLLVYRRYYGSRLTLRLLGLFWAIMSASGLVTEELFRAAGVVPTARPVQIASDSFSWNYTTILNLLALAAFGVLFWLYRHRERLGGGQGYATDVICGMQVMKSQAPAHRSHDGRDYWFCSDRCADRFSASPQSYAGAGAASGSGPSVDGEEPEEEDMAKDPICGMTVDPGSAAAVRRYEDRNYFFCAPGCAETFDQDPARYAEVAIPGQ